MKKGIKWRHVAFLGAALTMLFIVGMSFASAGIVDWFGKVTGHATSQDTNVTVTVSGTTAVTIEVLNSTLTGVNPTSDSTTAVTLTVRVTDADGYLDINTTSVHANFTKSGEAIRSNSSCVDLAQNTATAKNFSCILSMWYFDGSGIWSITAAGRDLGNTTLVQNTTSVFTYGTLQEIKMSPNQITFASVAQGAVNITSDNDPTLINNSGNYNFVGVNITAVNLRGETNTTVFINVGNITIGNNTHASNKYECDVAPVLGSNATALVNGTTVNVKHSVISKGNNSVNDGTTGQEQIYYCFRTIPTGILSQAYSTAYTGGAWVVSANV